MRKYLLMAIALFITGQMCKAQSLLSGKMLKTQKTIAVKTSKAPARAEANTTEYWLAAQSYYDSYQQFHIEGAANYRSAEATLTIDGEDATIDGLFDLTGFEYCSPVTNSLKGRYDADAHTLTIQTPVYDPNKSPSAYTSLGTMIYYGSDANLVVFAGTWSDEAIDGQYPLTTVSELVFDVSDDLSTLTARTGYGCYAFYTYDDSGVGFLDFYKSSQLLKLSDDANLLSQPDTMTFSGCSVVKGAILTATMKLSNTGKTATDYTISTSGKELSVDASGHLDAQSYEECQVTFKPNAEGTYRGFITFTSANGSTTTTEVKAEVGTAPDFSSIVKEGDFTFFFDDDYQFAITDTITGYPVAVSTNEGNSTQSTINVAFTVPEGKTGAVSWKGTSNAMMPNGVRIYLDDDNVYDNHYLSNGAVTHDDITNLLVVGSGDHLLKFVNGISLDWYSSGTVTEQLKTWIYDMSLLLTNTSDDAVIAKESTLDFGRHYYDKLSVHDTLTVTLVNVGSNPLQVTGSDDTDNFSVLVEDTTVNFGEELPVQIAFVGQGIDEYSGNVTLHTTAGDVVVGCLASAEKIIYDYSPIVSEGEFSFNTSFQYPFVVEGDQARSDIAGTTDRGIPTAWLEASFEVPDGQEGVLSWEANNSSLGFFDFMGESVLEDGSYITIDGGHRKEFAGENVDCSSTQYDSEDLLMQPGRHNVRFSYQKIGSSIVGLDRLLVYNLGLNLQETTGVGKVAEDHGALTRTEIFSVEGKKMDKLQNGVNIIRKTYDDGTVVTTKRVVR